MSEENLATLMRSHVEATERPSRVLDLDRAMRTGRRQRLAQRTAMFAVAAATVAVVAGIAITVVKPLGKTYTPAGPTITAIEPGVRHLRFGWLPDGVTKRSYTSQRDTAEILGAGGNGFDVLAVLYPRGAVPGPMSGEGGQASFSDGPDIQGHRSRWVRYPAPADPGTYLEWQYAPDALVRVTVLAPGQEDTLAVQVAQGLRIGSEPFALPFAYPTTSPLMVVNVFDNRFGQGEVNVRATYADGASILVATPGGPVIGQRTPNTTVDGRPANLQANELTVLDVNKVDVLIDAPTDPAGVYRRLELRGDIRLTLD